MEPVPKTAICNCPVLLNAEPVPLTVIVPVEPATCATDGDVDIVSTPPESILSVPVPSNPTMRSRPLSAPVDMPEVVIDNTPLVSARSPRIRS